MGDHGATNDGNHGGATEAELNAALFLYSKNKPITIPHFLQHFHPKEDNTDNKNNDNNNNNNDAVSTTEEYIHRTVSQIDIVPTLSLLLGIPVPFGNLGMVIVEPFLAQSGYSTTATGTSATINPTTTMAEIEKLFSSSPENAIKIVESFHSVNQALHMNCWQIFDYLKVPIHL